MTKLLVAEEKINSLSAALFIVGVGLLFYIHYPDMWAGLSLVFGVVLIIRQLLVGRIRDILFIVLVFGGIWASVTYNFEPDLIAPGLLVVGAIYLIIEQVTRYVMTQPAEPSKPTTEKEKATPAPPERPPWPSSKT